MGQRTDRIYDLLNELTSLAKRVDAIRNHPDMVNLEYEAPKLSPEDYRSHWQQLDESSTGDACQGFREKLFEIIEIYAQCDEPNRQIILDTCSQDAKIVLAYYQMATVMGWLIIHTNDFDLYRQLMVGFSLLDRRNIFGHHHYLQVAGLVERGLAAGLPVAPIALEFAELSSDTIQNADFTTISTRSFFLKCPLVEFGSE